MKTRNRIWLAILPILLMAFAVMGLLIVTSLTTVHSGNLAVSSELAKLQAASDLFLNSNTGDGQDNSDYDAVLKQRLRDTLAVLTRNAESARRTTLDILVFVSLAALGVFIAALLAGYLMATHIARPTGILREHARRIAGGDFTPIGTIHGSSEIKQLARDIDTMRERLKEHITGLDALVMERTSEQERSNRHLKAVFDSSPTGILRVDQQGHILQANPAISNMLGYTPQQLTQMTIKDITYPSDWPADKRALEQMCEGNGSTAAREKRYLHRDGSIRWGSVARSLVQHPDGCVDFIIGAISDVGEAKRYAEELASRESDYRLLFSSMSAGCALHEIICDETGVPVDYRFLDINPAFEALTGLKHEAVVGRAATEVLPSLDPFWIETYGAVALTGRATNFEHFSEELSRHFFVTAYCPQKGHFAVIFSDISWQKKDEEERRRLESQVQHAQKLESLGVLAGGIAHDFNNLLMGILGNADLAQSQFPNDAPAKRELQEIEKSAQRAAELCRQMLAYSGRAQFTVEALNLSRLVRDMQEMLKLSVSKKVDLRFDLSEDSSCVEADATQLRQITMNLVINASEAIKGIGTVTVKTGTRSCSKAFLRSTYLDDELPEGTYAFLEVTDTGCGIDAAILSRIFEPFFTTKFAGRGLGMAAVLGIIRGHRGAININSKLGSGTRFTVLLPTLDKAPEQPTMMTVEPVAVVGKGHILVVDDEDIVRRVASVMLERGGYEVSTATNGRDALEQLESRHFDCVLLDLTMPVMGGEEALRKIREKGLDVPIFMSSGYSEQEFRRNTNPDHVAGFIQKPYRSEDLLGAIQRFFASNPGAAKSPAK